MITFIVFFLILSVLILVHELGHFVAAKKAGVYVEEFGFGIPPRIIGKKIGETIYSLNLLPFGGFVKLAGEDETEISEELLPRSFMAKAAWKRAIILVAGVTMNLLLSIFLYFVFFMINDYKSQAIPMYFDDFHFRYGYEESLNTVVTGFLPESPAQESGIEPGEAIIEIDNTAVYNVPEVQAALENKVDTPTKILLMDLRTPEKDLRTVTVIPVASEDGKGIIGVYLTRSVILNYHWTKWTAPVKHVFNIMEYTYYTFSQLISVSVETKSVEPVSSGVSGPVGIFSVVGSIVAIGGRQAILGLIDLTALLSASLALLNLLPLPALDGGRLVFVLWEMFTGRRVKPSIEANLHKFGLLLFIGILILVTIKDVRTLIF